MIGLYRLVFLPLLLLALPYYAARMFRRGGYAEGFSHRFGRISVPPKREGVKRLWIQAVSVGEIEAIGPLLRELAKVPSVEVVLTTTTSTGYAIAREKYASIVVATGVFPVDFWLFNRAAWARIRPDAIVLTEGELWPEHLHRAMISGVPAVLINARVSDRSFARYSRVRWIAARLLKKLATVLPGTVSDAERFAALGVPADRLGTPGNLKFDVDVGGAPTETEREQLFAELFGETPSPEGRPTVLLGSSTWPGEESVLLRTYRDAVAAGADVRLLLVPRHAERRTELAALMADASESWYFRSQHRTGAPHPARIVIADTTGELRRLTRAADLAFIGKSLPPNAGGQTPIECAALGVPMVCGPDMTNFRDITRGLSSANALRVTGSADEAREALLAHLRDRDARIAMGERSRAWHAGNRGATTRTLAALLRVIGE